MNANSNSYTFIFAAALVVVVAAILSFTAVSLDERQDANVRKEKMQSILASIKVNVSREEAAKAFDAHVKDQVVLRNGEKVQGTKAFNISMAKQVSKPIEERKAPLYVAEKEGKTYYIIPLRGKGLWGPIWGYISLKSDGKTVYGAVFDHKSETPGLGAEINTDEFQAQFPKKAVFGNNGDFTGIKVTKKPAKGPHQVDGISGGTITSNGVQKMITDCVAAYKSFLKKDKGQYADDSNLPKESELAIAE